MSDEQSAGVPPSKYTPQYQRGEKLHVTFAREHDRYAKRLLGGGFLKTLGRVGSRLLFAGGLAYGAGVASNVVRAQHPYGSHNKASDAATAISEIAGGVYIGVGPTVLGIWRSRNNNPQEPR